MKARFALLFAQHLERCGMSENAFAKAIGRSQGFVNKVANGGKPPPKTGFARWCDVLKLDAVEAAAFEAEWLNATASAQTRAAPRIQALEAELAETRAIAARLVGLCLKKGLKVPEDIVKRLGL